MIEAERLLFVEIDDASGGADDHVDIRFELVELLLIIDAAVDQREFQVQMFA